jgi:hypothetical protein
MTLFKEGYQLHIQNEHFAPALPLYLHFQGSACHILNVSYNNEKLLSFHLLGKEKQSK